LVHGCCPRVLPGDFMATAILRRNMQCSRTVGKAGKELAEAHDHGSADLSSFTAPSRLRHGSRRTVLRAAEEDR
jgi:hypothetical protein